MERFNIENFLKKVSLQQYLETAKNLEDSIKKINPNIESELLLTTNGDDYNTWGSLTIINLETNNALDRREKCSLKDLDKNLWKKSFKTSLCIYDDTKKEPYMIILTNETREPRSMRFYSQCLDEKSQEVFDSFRKTNLFQRLGTGHSKPSQFAGYHALSQLKK